MRKIELLLLNLNHKLNHNLHVVVYGMSFFGICIVHGFLNLDLRGHVKLEIVIVEIVIVGTVSVILMINKVISNPQIA